MKIKEFLLDDQHIDRDSFLWNMIGSMLMAFQSVIMLMILTRVLGLVDAGIFTIAFANANLFLNIGKYGMRNFQVSDVKKQFSFADYKISRIITVIAMLLTSVGYTLYTAYENDYSAEKTQIIIWMCLFKIVDAAEDIYHGYYQQENRLDIASKCLALRMLSTILVFSLGLIFFKNQLIALIISTILTAFLFLIFTKWTIGEFHSPSVKCNKKNVRLLLKLCFPLFAGAFLSFYIGNAPKYAIDATLSDELQACYGFIAMPVFVIGLLNSFIFNPMLYKMTQLWDSGKVKKFVAQTILQSGIVFVITIICIGGAYLLGIPVLSWLYNTDLSPYKTELIILLLGGGFLGFSGLLNAFITIIRCQKWIMWGYVLIAILAFIFSNPIVEMYGMLGASVLYTALMGGLCIIFVLLFIYGILKYKNK
ncbi:lipopolysaccharide biosynthesis protein [Mediterraneibacter glycyrrhizinilyticus]|uniref:lipopolysaccharide biosynthesis protein n=1 Tax=Mediterraneibacter glycyrrhizinilyticus TaxID=342942 RepID=UPI00189C88C2|nr:lipopolysaccharide biosynthesis protein [Mediterraneibacter glycyrrhizinilyticus]